MARKIDKISSIEIKIHKNGLDISTVNISAKLIDDNGAYKKDVSHVVVLSSLGTAAKNTITALVKALKGALETRENLTPLPDPIIRDPGGILL